MAHWVKELAAKTDTLSSKLTPRSSSDLHMCGIAHTHRWGGEEWGEEEGDHHPLPYSEQEPPAGLSV